MQRLTCKSPLAIALATLLAAAAQRAFAQAPLGPEASAFASVPAELQLVPLPPVEDAPSTEPQSSMAPAEPGPQPQGWTLAQAESTALQFNPIVQRAIARIESAQGDARQAGLYPNPRFDTNNPQIFAATSSSFNVGFQQEIIVKGKLRLDRAAATEVVRQREIGLTQDRMALLTAVRQQFYTVLADQRRVEVLVHVRDLAAAAVLAARRRVEATEGTLPEVLLLETELQSTEINLKNAETDLEADRRQLTAIIGRPDLMIARVSGELTHGFPEFDRQELRAFVIAQNAQVQIARREIDRNQILARRARVEAFPNPTMGPAYYFTVPQTVSSQQFWFNITFDIPTWNRNQGGIRAAKANVADAVASLGTVQNGLLRQVDDALGRYQQARQSEQRYRTQILPTAMRGAQLTRDGYEKGVLDVSTYLTAQRAFADASSEYVDALQQTWSVAAELAGLLQREQFP